MVVSTSSKRRPSEVDALIGDASKAERLIGWSAKTDWQDLARIMVEADRASLEDQWAGRAYRIDR